MLYAPDGRPVAPTLTDNEKVVELLCVAFGLLSGVMAETGELSVLGQKYGSQEAFVNAYVAELVRVVGADTLKARFPGLEFKAASSPARLMREATEALKGAK
jgi:hypothetical protein